MYIWGDVCLSLYFHHSIQLSFFFSLYCLPNLLPLYFSLSCNLSWCSLTPIVVVLVPFLKPWKSVSYQIRYYKRTDPGSFASQHDSTSGACQPPQANGSQISTLIWTKLSPYGLNGSNSQTRVSPSFCSPTFSMWGATRSRRDSNQSRSWKCQILVK